MHFLMNFDGNLTHILPTPTLLPKKLTRKIRLKYPNHFRLNNILRFAFDDFHLKVEKKIGHHRIVIIKTF